MQGDIQASANLATGLNLDYNGALHALFDLAGIAKGDFNGRLLAWINFQLGATYTEINGAMAAFCAANGVANFEGAISPFLNLVPNPWDAGAVVGTPGTPPTGWTITSAGLNTQIVATGLINGVSTIDIRFYGTSTGQYFAIVFDPSASCVSGETAFYSASIALISNVNTANISYYGLGIGYYNNSTPLSYYIGYYAPTSNIMLFGGKNVYVNGSVNKKDMEFFCAFTGASGQTADFTLRIQNPVLGRIS